MHIPLKVTMAALMVFAPVSMPSVQSVTSDKAMAETSQEIAEPPSTTLRLSDSDFLVLESSQLTQPVFGKSKYTEEMEAKVAEEARITAEKAEKDRLERIATAKRARNKPIPAQIKPQRVLATEPSNSSSLQDYARQLVVEKWGYDHWDAFDFIVSHESGWNPNARNSSSGACGLGQALPCSKMPDHSPEGQVRWVISYIEGRYGTPNNARSFWLAHNWY